MSTTTYGGSMHLNNIYIGPSSSEHAKLSYATTEGFRVNDTSMLIGGLNKTSAPVQISGSSSVPIAYIGNDSEMFGVGAYAVDGITSTSKRIYIKANPETGLIQWCWFDGTSETILQELKPNV